jgi:hypothetical protein
MASKSEDVKPKSGSEDKVSSVEPATSTNSTSAPNGSELKSPSPNRQSNLPGINGSPSTQGKSRFNLGANGAQGSSESVGLGAKSMPGSRRTSAMTSAGAGAGGETFGLDKLSLSTGQVGEGREEDVGAEGARGECLDSDLSRDEVLQDGS